MHEKESIIFPFFMKSKNNYSGNKNAEMMTMLFACVVMEWMIEEGYTTSRDTMISQFYDWQFAAERIRDKH